ncbi:MAG: peptide chain release factor N(5)-glutamine methyltransferase [Proteobacteria bacterium]|nr:peptide chain release factor N(5)-glutamine methyltransferase [Pseudomonadota bacterium]
MAASMDVAAALALARRRGVDRLDAQVLLAHHLAQPRTWLIAHDDAPLPAEVQQRFTADLESRAAGAPLAYLLGEREFHGLRLAVTPAVLVPRPETEVLVDWALALLGAQPGEQTGEQTDGQPGAPRVIDLGTGSGAIAVSVARRCPAARVSATDIDAGALAVARANAQALGCAIELHQGSWWSAVAGQRFELALSNPPYIAGDDPHLAALRYEPRHALTPGGDGLDALRMIVAGAPAHLEAGGWLLVEHGFDQGAAVRALLVDAGFETVQTRRDLAGHERCSGGRWGAGPAAESHVTGSRGTAGGDAKHAT